MTKRAVAEVVDRPGILDELQQTSKKVVAILGGLSAVSDPGHRNRIIDRYTPMLVESVARQRALLDQLGLYGPAEG